MISATGWKAVALWRESSCFDEDEVVADQIENFFNRQKRDGTSPWAGLCGLRSACTWDSAAWRLRRPGDDERIAENSPRWRRRLLPAQVSHSRERLRHFRDVGGLVALAAVGLRSEKRRIGLDQDAVEWEFLGDVAKVLRFGIGGIAGEGNHEAHVESALGVFERAGEAVENAAEAGGSPVLLRVS